MVKLKLLVAAMLLSVGCGDNPASPSKILPANIISTNNGTFSTIASYGSTFHAVMKNTGTGCASHVRGVITFSTGTGIKLITLQWVSDIQVIRPGETFVFTVQTEADLTLSQTFKVEANWVNAVCY